MILEKLKELGMDLPWHVLTTALCLAVLAYIAAKWMQQPDFPTINDYPGDYSRKRAHSEFISSARKLVETGLSKFNGPFRILTPFGSRIILPASYIDFVKSTDKLDHPALVREEYFSAYPGFEGNNAIHTDPAHTLSTVAKSRLNQNTQVKILHDQMNSALSEIWGDLKTVSWSESAVRFIGQMSSTIFVGPELAANKEWQDLTISYTMNMFEGVRSLKTYPSFLRPLVHWVLPSFRKCRAQVSRAQQILAPLLAERMEARKAAGPQGRGKVIFEDAIEYMELERSRNPKARFDAAAAQLGFAIAALHTTTQLLQQSLIDILLHLDIIPALREDINSALEESGWTTAGLANMVLLDSCIKETQRLKPGTIVNLERLALEDVQLPDGRVLRKGTSVAVESGDMWNDEVYPDAKTWDAHRFLKLREEGKTWTSLVSTSKEHTAFGIGKPVCPGRFFAANEVKVALAAILTGYDVNLLGEKPIVMEYGWEMLSDPGVKLEIRRRA